MKPAGVVIGLSAVVVAIRDGDAVVLTVRQGGQPAGLPFGPFDPGGHRTFELALRAFVTAQTRFDLGYVEQLYTFGDKGRDAPLADMGEELGAGRVLSVGYLALTPKAVDTTAPDTGWASWARFFPYEDWREGRPAALTEIEPALRQWAVTPERLSRARLLFALDAAPWNEERVLERYELLYEAGLVLEAARDRNEAEKGLPLGEPMISDHRRILATAIARLRAKLKYRPVVFELLPDEFTLTELQRTVEAISGRHLHKQNFRRLIEQQQLVEETGAIAADTVGRPAKLFRFRHAVLAERAVAGTKLPLSRT